MKKMWIIAAVACAALMVSCGGEKKGNGKEQVDVVAKAKEYKAEGEAILRAGDPDAAEAWLAEVEAWIKTLSKEDQKKVKRILK